MATWSDERDAALRDEAMAWLERRTHDGLYPVSRDELHDFAFADAPFALLDPQAGIRKPKELSSALSIRTVFTPAGKDGPYDDHMGSDGLARYQWRGDDADHYQNRGLRSAMLEEKPLIWFWGISPGVYQAIFPIYLVAEEPEKRQFAIATDGIQRLLPRDSPMEETLRRYVRAETLRRLHQPVFRSMVMRAYETRCAVCALRHGELLDAAHIVEDRHELGVAAVRNGLALCKIHHAAYDARIMGVRPDLVIQVRHDILEEIDGPLLEHGLKSLHGKPLAAVPRSRRERPDEQLLEHRYRLFTGV